MKDPKIVDQTDEETPTGCSLIQSLEVSRTEDHDGTPASRAGCVVL
jgi:hypothetical protein